MALATLKFYSQALGTQAEINVIIPQRPANEENKANEKYKCLYLLHGFGDDHSTWLRNTSIERYADNYGICVVVPYAEKSFYTNMKYGADYYTYIAEEVPSRVCEFFNVSNKREDNFVAGFSMGGYGALKIALRECDRFVAGAGLSPCGDIKTIGFKEELRPIFGDELNIPEEDDLLCLADKQAANPNKPRIFIGIGTKDFLLENNVGLRKKFKDNGYDFTYCEAQDFEHNYEFCDEYIQHILKWMFG